MTRVDQPPGEAFQFDWGEVHAYLDGKLFAAIFP